MGAVKGLQQLSEGEVTAAGLEGNTRGSQGRAGRVNRGRSIGPSGPEYWSATSTRVRYADPVSLYRPDVVTLWVMHCTPPDAAGRLFDFSFDEDGGPEPSPFALAYRIGWYDTDFAELHTGVSAAELLTAAAQQCRTLDEQAMGRLPAGEWNGLYLLYGRAGDAWASPEARPAMPHGVVDVDGAKFKLVDTFHVLMRP